MNKDVLVLIGVIVADALLLFELLYFILRRNTSNKLFQAAFQGDDARFEAIAGSLGGKTLSAFDKELIRFNVAEARKEQSNIEASIRNFEQMNLKDSQKKKIYQRIFYYYVDRNKKSEAKKYYQELESLNVYKNKKDVEVTYDTFINGGHKYLNETLERAKKARPQELPALERNISRMYENKGVHSEAKKYARLAERHQRELEERSGARRTN